MQVRQNQEESDNWTLVNSGNSKELIRNSTNANGKAITLSTNQTGVTANCYVALAAFSNIPGLDNGSNMFNRV